MVRRRRAVGLTVAAIALIALAAALPWAHTGRASRSAFALARTADELGIVRGPLARGLFVGLAFLPAAAAGAWIAAVMEWRRVVAALGVVGGLLTFVGVIAVWRAPVDMGAGVALATVAGLLSLIGAALITRTERRGQRE